MSSGCEQVFLSYYSDEDERRMVELSFLKGYRGDIMERQTGNRLAASSMRYLKLL
jgi:hypothetical protein